MTTGPRKRSSPRNEGKACDAVVRCLEYRMGETRAAIRRPEKESIGPPVDFHLMLGTREYAIEHTRIEAVPGLIRTGEGYAQLIKPVIAELSGTLPGPADYWLYFPLDTHLGVKKAELDRIRQGLIAWVRVKAQCLYERNLNRLEREHKSPRYIDSIEANPPGFHYPVRLWVRPALSGSERGTLGHARYAPGNEELEARRTVRLRQALSRKSPKLQRCKEDGARTVLVLESDDIALTDHVAVGECLAGLLVQREDLPDEIYLVETDVDPWTVHCMKLDTECWPMENSAEPPVFRVDDLIDLSQATPSEREPQQVSGRWPIGA